MVVALPAHALLYMRHLPLQLIVVARVRDGVPKGGGSRVVLAVALLELGAIWRLEHLGG